MNEVVLLLQGGSGAVQRADSGKYHDTGKSVVDSARRLWCEERQEIREAIKPDEQKRVAEAYIKQLDAAKVFDRPIVTEVVPLDRFYEAEAYHQDYAARNPMNPYILFTARPKVDKVRKYYKDRIKSAR